MKKWKARTSTQIATMVWATGRLANASFHTGRSRGRCLSGRMVDGAGDRDAPHAERGERPTQLFARPMLATHPRLWSRVLRARHQALCAAPVMRLHELALIHGGVANDNMALR